MLTTDETLPEPREVLTTLSSLHTHLHTITASSATRALPFGVVFDLIRIVTKKQWSSFKTGKIVNLFL